MLYQGFVAIFIDATIELSKRLSFLPEIWVGKGVFFVSKIIDMIDDFRMNQEIMRRKPRYIDVCMYRLKMLKDFIETIEVYEVEEVKPIHVKKFIKERQNFGRECNRTISNTLSTMKVFINYLVEEEFMDEFDNPMRRIKSLKEDDKVIVTFNDEEVSRIINDVREIHTQTLEIS